MQGRTIKIFLTEGTPNDITTAEIVASWTGKVILLPRTKLGELANRSEAQRAGVYILVGEDPDFPAKEQIYIGESDDVLKRLKQHNKDEKKDFWNRTIIVISKDEHLTKSLVRYLESRLIEIVGQAHRATLNNGSAPDTPHLPESDIADMEYFLARVQMLLPVLGFSFILPAPAIPLTPVSVATTTPGPTATLPRNSPLFQMKIVGAEARAQEIGSEFVVFKNSTARSSDSPGLSRGYADLRAQLLAEGKVAGNQVGGLWVFTENVPFTSPSAAAAVVAGTNQNGRVAWKDAQTNQTYKDWQEGQLSSVSAGLDEAGEEQGEPLQEKEVVLELGDEGGGETIYGHKENGEWVFWSEGTSIDMDEDDVDFTRPLRKARTSELTDLLPEHWVKFYPLRVHAEFATSLRQVYEQQVAALSPKEKEFHHLHRGERWNNLLRTDSMEQAEVTVK